MHLRVVVLACLYIIASPADGLPVVDLTQVSTPPSPSFQLISHTRPQLHQGTPPYLQRASAQQPPATEAEEGCPICLGAIHDGGSGPTAWPGCIDPLPPHLLRELCHTPGCPTATAPMPNLPARMGRLLWPCVPRTVPAPWSRFARPARTQRHTSPSTATTNPTATHPAAIPTYIHTLPYLTLHYNTLPLPLPLTLPLPLPCHTIPYHAYTHIHTHTHTHTHIHTHTYTHTCIPNTHHHRPQGGRGGTITSKTGHPSPTSQTPHHHRPQGGNHKKQDWTPISIGWGGLADAEPYFFVDTCSLKRVPAIAGLAEAGGILQLSGEERPEAHWNSWQGPHRRHRASLDGWPWAKWWNHSKFKWGHPILGKANVASIFCSFTCLWESPASLRWWTLRVDPWVWPRKPCCHRRTKSRWWVVGAPDAHGGCAEL